MNTRQQKTRPQTDGGQQFGSSDYVRRFVDQYQKWWGEQIHAWQDMLRSPPTSISAGIDETSKWVGRAVDVWGTWFSSLRDLMGVPGQSTRVTPILAFVVDSNAETSVAQTLKLLPNESNFEPDASDLFALKGSQHVSRAHVAARIDGGQLRVSLVDLGHTVAERQQRAIVPGRYVGAILRGSASDLAVALVDVTFLG